MKRYKKPQTLLIHLHTEQVIASSPTLKDELGDENQLSNERTGWDNPEWAEEKE